STRPRNSRANRSSGSRLVCSCSFGTERCSAETVTSTGDMASARNATRARRRHCERSEAIQGPCALPWIASSSFGLLAMTAWNAALVPRDRHAVVDQVVDGGLHVDARRNDAGLLQGNAGGEDRLALRRAHAVVGDLGALLELLVGDRVGQLGHRDEDVFQLVVMGERIFARLFVDGERALRE